MKKPQNHNTKHNSKLDFKYCRTCYKHLAGQMGVLLTEAMEAQGYLEKTERAYTVTEAGWHWLSRFDIRESDFAHSKRPLTRQCIDGTEKRPHLAGALGDRLLSKMLDNGWFKRVPSTRILTLAPNKHHILSQHFGIKYHENLEALPRPHKNTVHGKK